MSAPATAAYDPDLDDMEGRLRYAYAHIAGERAEPGPDHTLGLRMDGGASEFAADPLYDDLGVEETQRQARIAAGVEHTCVVCGCSESRACPGGCVWAKPNLCSRCASAAREAFP